MTDNPALEEYRILALQLQHMDEQNWNWGAFLFGGTLAATGLVLSQRVGWLRLLGLALVATVILGGYILYVHRDDTIQDVLRARMRQIEAQYLPTVLTERIMQSVKDCHPFPWDNRSYSLARISCFQALELMAFGYLALLWGGTFAAWLLSKGLLKLN
jgi:hypothetical protein